jgi:hypothetical protein
LRDKIGYLDILFSNRRSPIFQIRYFLIRFCGLREDYGGISIACFLCRFNRCHHFQCVEVSSSCINMKVGVIGFDIAAALISSSLWQAQQQQQQTAVPCQLARCSCLLLPQGQHICLPAPLQSAHQAPIATTIVICKAEHACSLL